VNTDTALDASGTLTTTYAQLATSGPVLRWAIARTGARLSASELENSVSATSNTVSRFVTLTVANPDPVLAARLARAIGSRLAVLAKQVPPGALPLLQALDSQPEVQALDGPVRQAVDVAAKRVLGVDPIAGLVTVADPAIPADAPSSPKRGLLSVLAGLIGLALAAIVVLAREMHARGALDEQAISAIDASAYIGSLEVVRSRRPAQSLPVESAPGSSAAEQYRVLAARLRLLDRRPPVRSLLVLDAADGTTAGTVAANLAAAVREADHDVLLVDANSTDAGSTWLLGLQGSPGYSDAMANPETLLNGHLSELCVPRGERLRILPRGTDQTLSTQLTPDRVQHALERLRTTADVLIIAGPPILRSPAALTWAEAAEGTVLVIDAEAISQGQVLEAVRDLDLVKAHTLGLVLGHPTRPPLNPLNPLGR
jgi:Mrp family chromosome partitioning ATPase/capsular polysaccharide biosynthesis protein